ncbi:hypothetical protein A2630_04380 [Candidatus Woesebacteria bacterium RIFCSPHIGHO2_01_FULL_44_10]|uniref:Uncharacterized protein n=1 Tax=Candidatus Woesebacteria bacterium RIFCSPLOWO2_01_FULL_44_14 TaxID=1802525 RepID=A0A1F8C3K8_9BACT|nr:MAG: hypothetical protein A2630_04380 [Candidatus Woesebacteria bacterium RIFCSPHIGHO2_01_FULL_44_10]OGM56018.1 MAG: hypothetical protein A3F62_03805 [Candidatus Woesebacteria bacterium RIFCSPHIGHO2_12_FULL_44_11]OGM70740.1 MAG: hypothetical protein A2975_02515 [Candidatus Woesebacteria bacterium RIFCSPLOWO2_01_FULL_44_14]
MKIFGSGPVKILLLGQFDGLKVLSKKLSNLSIVVVFDKNIGNIKHFVKVQDRPFGLVLDLSVNHGQVFSSSTRKSEILKKTGLDLPVAKKDKSFVDWVNFTYELPAFEIGAKVDGLDEIVTKMLTYFNGKED